MKIQFKDTDIGKLVSMELDPKTSEIAKNLGATAVEIYGKIIEVGDESVKIQLFAPRPAQGLSQGRIVKNVPYASIMRYYVHTAQSNSL